MHDPAQSVERLPVRFLLWPSQSLRCCLFAVQHSKELLIDSPWVRDTRKNLDRSMRGDITLLHALGVLDGLMGVQLAEGSMSLSIPDFISWMEDLPSEHPIWDTEQAPHVPALDPNGEWFRLFDVDPDPEKEPLRKGLMERFHDLFKSPSGLKALTVDTCSAFWKDRFSEEYARLEPILRRAVAIGSQDRAPRSYYQLCLELIGRTPLGPPPPGSYRGDVLVAPVCHLGAFPLRAFFDNPRWTTFYAFEAARMPAIAFQEEGPSPSIYKALGDAKRLEIIRLLGAREMYGLELSKHLGISQPAVSKHLRILASEGILKLRRDGLIKYYSVDRDRLDEIAESIRQLKGTAEPE